MKPGIVPKVLGSQTMTAPAAASPTGVDPIAALMNLVLAYCRSQGLGTVARLGIADLLAGGPLPVATLAERACADEESLYRVLRALAVEGVFAEHEGRVFAHTPMSEGLATEHPRSVRWLAAAMCDHAHWQPWGHAYDAVVEGRSQTPKVLGGSPWEYLSGSPEEAGRFGQAMTNMSMQAIEGISASYDFAGLEHLVDVGGNRGSLLLEILARYPQAHGTIFDLPEVIEVARGELAEHPLLDRVEFTGGSFFEEIPAGADAYLLKHILHDWPDEECRRILRATRAAIPGHGRVLVFDALLVPEAPAWAHWLDVHMMILQDGKERSPEEFAALFAATGFEMTAATPIPSPVAIIEARPV